MASPMVDGRVEPHRKATYTLEISDQVRREGRSGTGLSGVKYNHKPNLARGTRTANLKLADNNTYNLSLRDKDDAGNRDVFVFNGSRTASSKSFVLLFDQTTQSATLERLDSSFTLNLATKNGTDVSSDHGKIYPKKAHKDSVHDREEGEVDLFGEEADDEANAGTDADASNPYDFRHFLNAVKSKKDKETAEDRGYASSPDHRSNAAPSSANTPLQPARRAVDPAKKRKPASVFASKPAAKGAPKKTATPAINLERRATERAVPAPPSKAAAGPPSSKIKSAEFIQESDDDSDVDMDMDMDIDAEGDPDSSAPSPKHTTHSTRRSPSPIHHRDSSATSRSPSRSRSPSSGLEIEIPDASRSRSHTHRPHHLNPRSNAASRTLRSPSNGPISLASAANSVENTPRRGVQADEIDFGDMGGEDDDAEGEVDDEEDEEGEFEDVDVDVERMDIGPPAARRSVGSGGGGGGGGGGAGAGGASASASASATAAPEVDEDDPLYMEMMEGLAGGESSEESEEE